MTKTYLLNDKFIPPKPPDIYAPRRSLITLFYRESLKRIIYVSAPAGYGKTVSTQLWLKDSNLVPLWISLDEYDNTSSIFYKLFATGLVSLQPENRGMAEILSSPSFAASPVEHTIRILSEFIPDTKRYAIVLDDMHLVTNEEIRKSGLLVQKRLPASVVVVILTRNEISDEYTAITGEENCVVIAAQDLAFSTEEIQKYFNAHGRFITREEADAARAVTNGWAIGINALVMSGQTEFGQSVGGVLENYIETQIWNKWNEDMRMFLLKTSILDEITPELAEKLTSVADSRKTLEKLCADNMFVNKSDDDHFHYHSLFLKFLREMLKKHPDIDTGALNKCAARFFYDSGKYYMAAEYYIQSGDHHGMSMSIDKLNDYDGGLGVEEQFNRIGLLVNNARGKASGEALMNNVFWLEKLSWYYFLAGNANLFLHYIDVLSANMPIIAANYPAFWETFGFICALDFREELHEYSKKLAEGTAGTSNKAEDKKVRSSSLTQNLPYIHRSMRDFSSFANDIKTCLSHLEAAFAPLVGQEYYVIADCILAGLFYEKNLLAKAMEYALSACEKCNSDYGVESKFSAQMILAQISWAMGRQNFDVSCKEIADLLENENVSYLNRNFMAFKTRLKLWDADEYAAQSWLDNYFVTERGHLEFFKIYQHFTTVRAYITLARTNKALSFISELKKLALDYRRPLDIAEASVLQAVIEWATGSKEEAMDVLAGVLAAMQKYGFVRVIADEGAAVLPILRKLALNLKKTRYHGILSAHFLNEVTIAAYEQSRRYKGISTSIRAQKQVKLSKRQNYIVTLMARGYNNAEIVNITKLTIHTIKSHQAAAYAKLDVNSAMDAVVKAKELGLIE